MRPATKSDDDRDYWRSTASTSWLRSRRTEYINLSWELPVTEVWMLCMRTSITS